MSITTLFLAVIASIVVWFFLQQRLLAKPWLEEGPIDEEAHSPCRRRSSACACFLPWSRFCSCS